MATIEKLFVYGNTRQAILNECTREVHRRWVPRSERRTEDISDALLEVLTMKVFELIESEHLARHFSIIDSQENRDLIAVRLAFLFRTYESDRAAADYRFGNFDLAIADKILRRLVSRSRRQELCLVLAGRKLRIRPKQLLSALSLTLCTGMMAIGDGGKVFKPRIRGMLAHYGFTYHVGSIVKVCVNELERLEIFRCVNRSYQASSYGRRGYCQKYECGRRDVSELPLASRILHDAQEQQDVARHALTAITNEFVDSLFGPRHEQDSHLAVSSSLGSTYWCKGVEEGSQGGGGVESELNLDALIDILRSLINTRWGQCAHMLA